MPSSMLLLFIYIPNDTANCFTVVTAYDINHTMTLSLEVPCITGLNTLTSLVNAEAAV